MKDNLSKMKGLEEYLFYGACVRGCDNSCQLR